MRLIVRMCTRRHFKALTLLAYCSNNGLKADEERWQSSISVCGYSLLLIWSNRSFSFYFCVLQCFYQVIIVRHSTWTHLWCQTMTAWLHSANMRDIFARMFLCEKFRSSARCKSFQIRLWAAFYKNLYIVLRAQYLSGFGTLQTCDDLSRE